MTDGSSGPVERPARGRGRWTSFVAAPPGEDRPARALHEAGNPRHRVRVEHDAHTLLIHLSDEEGPGWTTVAVDRATRAWAVAQRGSQLAAAAAASGTLYAE